MIQAPERALDISMVIQSILSDWATKIQEGWHFPRWPRANTFFFKKLDELIYFGVKINVLKMLNSPLNVPCNYDVDGLRTGVMLRESQWPIMHVTTYPICCYNLPSTGVSSNTLMHLI